MLKTILLVAAAAALFTGCVDSTQPFDKASDIEVETLHSSPVLLHGVVVTQIQMTPLGCKGLEGVTKGPFITTTVSDCVWNAAAGGCDCTVSIVDDFPTH